MANNTLNSNYRKLDVDSILQDVSDDDGNEKKTTPTVQGPDEAAVLSLLRGARQEEALHTVLQNCPAASKDRAVKDKATLLVIKVITSFKASEAEALAAKLTVDEADVLLKYVFRAFELQPDNSSCAMFLAWHKAITKIYGVGAICRIICDRDRL